MGIFYQCHSNSKWNLISIENSNMKKFIDNTNKKQATIWGRSHLLVGKLPHEGTVNSVCIRSYKTCALWNSSTLTITLSHMVMVKLLTMSSAEMNHLYFFCAMKTAWTPSLLPSCHGSNSASWAMLTTFFAKPASCSLLRSKMYLRHTMTHKCNRNAITGVINCLSVNLNMGQVASTKHHILRANTLHCNTVLLVTVLSPWQQGLLL